MRLAKLRLVFFMALMSLALLAFCCGCATDKANADEVSSSASDSPIAVQDLEWKGGFGPLVSSQTGVVCVEPQTGTRIIFPGILDGVKIEELGLAYELDFALRKIDDSGSVVNVVAVGGAGIIEGVQTLKDVQEKVVNYWDKYKVLGMTDNSITITKEPKISGDDYNYYWCYLLDDGSFLEVYFASGESNHRELADQVVIEFGAYPGKGTANLKSDT